MEASAVPREAPAGVAGWMSPHVLRLASDASLVALIREGSLAAFEAAYNRHHRGILSFCRHVLGDAQEAEDAVQHTFLSAYNHLTSSEKPIHLRAWLFTIARNRCYSILRGRREQPTADLQEQATEGIAAQVQWREDLRELVVDMRRLPSDQRAALVLAEFDALSHEQIAQVLGVPREKVKALVFQARESLLATRRARETDCAEIREQLATQRGGGLRRTNLRRHLQECPGCRDFRREVERQRRRLAVIVPVAPTVALKEAVMAGTAGTVPTVGGGGALITSSVLKGSVFKALAVLLLAALGTTLVESHSIGSQAGSTIRPGGMLVGGGPSGSAAPNGLRAYGSGSPSASAIQLLPNGGNPLPLLDPFAASSPPAQPSEGSASRIENALPQRSGAKAPSNPSARAISAGKPSGPAANVHGVGASAGKPATGSGASGGIGAIDLGAGGSAQGKPPGRASPAFPGSAGGPPGNSPPISSSSGAPAVTGASQGSAASGSPAPQGSAAAGSPPAASGGAVAGGGGVLSSSSGAVSSDSPPATALPR